MTYSDLITMHAQNIKIELMHVIENRTMRQTWSFYINLHVDFGVQNYLMRTATFSSSKKAGKRRRYYESLTNRRFILHRTNNDLNYTRLI